MAGDGRSNREHYQQVEKSRGIRVPELHPEPPPDQTIYLWYWFLDLNASRANDGFTPSAISYSEIYAWSELTGHHPTPWELRILRRLDMTFLRREEE